MILSMHEILFIVLCLVPSMQVASHDTECGVNCLYIAMISQNDALELPVDAIKAMLKPGDRGNSIAELELAAKKLGFHALPVQTTLEALAERKRPFAFIAHLKRGHFVLFTDLSTDTVSIADPPVLTNVNRVSLQTEWDGTGLLISSLTLESEAEIMSRLWWQSFRWHFLEYGAILSVAAIIIWGMRLVFLRRRARR